jgi:hypothetical protein
MGLYRKYWLIGIAFLSLALPAWARVYRQPVTLDKSTTIGSVVLKPGSYEFVADDAKSELNVLQNNKVISTVPGQWIKLPQKTLYSSVSNNGNKITQVQFEKSDQAFQPQ